MANTPIGRALNTRPKYVASNTITDPKWTNTTVLSGDLAAAIRELKAKPGGDLQVHGSGVLTRWLLANDLLDELNLLIVPVFGGAADFDLELIESRTLDGHTQELIYRST